MAQSLYHRKLQDAHQAVEQPGGHEMGDGQEVTIKRNGSQFHTTSTRHDGTKAEADHPTFEEAMTHAAGHLGAKHQPAMREKNRHRKEHEPEHQEALEQAAGTETKGAAVSLGDMGVAGSEPGE